MEIVDNLSIPETYRGHTSYCLHEQFRSVIPLFYNKITEALV